MIKHGQSDDTRVLRRWTQIPNSSGTTTVLHKGHSLACSSHSSVQSSFSFWKLRRIENLMNLFPSIFYLMNIPNRWLNMFEHTPNWHASKECQCLIVFCQVARMHSVWYQWQQGNVVTNSPALAQHHSSSAFTQAPNQLPDSLDCTIFTSIRSRVLSAVALAQHCHNDWAKNRSLGGCSMQNKACSSERKVLASLR